MKNILKIALLCTVTAAATFAANIMLQHKDGATVQEIVSVSAKAKDSTTIEFPSLYSRVKEIPYGGEDTIHVGHLLRKMGFEQIDYGWGNGMAPVAGTRLAQYHKTGCNCEVYKHYYQTETEGLYTIKEGITCHPSK